MSSHRFVGVGVAAIAVFASVIPSAAASSKPEVIHAQSFGVSAPVRDLASAGGSVSAGAPSARVNPLAGESSAAVHQTRTRDSVPPDPLAARAAAGSRTPTPGLVFDGTGNPFACGGCLPPDTNGDVGPNNYVQIVNATKVAIFNKAGTPLASAFSLSALFPGGPCNPNDDGDPIALYDQQADRWLLAQFRDQGGPGPFHICFAISTTPDPLGAYFTYDFVTPNFPDYFKVGVWPTGYYVGTNEASYTAYAFDRTKMLAGDPSATGVRFPGQDNFLLPADVDGPRAPGSTEGGLFYTFKDDAFHGGADRLELFQLTPNFAAPASSTFTTIATIPIAPFTYTVCGFFILGCIPQSGTAAKLDAVSEWPMHRFAYRRFGDHQALVGNFTVGGGTAVPGAAPRWFELRNTGGGWSLFQEGTYDPGGGLNRFMGSISIDVEGNIALAYSASSSTTFPSIRYATRAPSDPPGTLGAEQVLKPGGGSQTATGSGQRWGDYSATSVDPADNCTFWHTNEYYAATSAATWSTAIGNFKVPTCADTDKDGVADGVDACPTTPNLTTPNGCPDNSFTIGKKKLNKKKGVATVKVTVPGAGELTLKGKNLKSQRPSSHGRAASKTVSAAGTVKLKIIPKGKTKKKLKKKGKAKVKAEITFTPTGGLAATQTTKAKLKKKEKK